MEYNMGDGESPVQTVSQEMLLCKGTSQPMKI